MQLPPAPSLSPEDFRAAAQRARLAAEAAAPGMDAGRLVERLLKEGRQGDAIRFLVQALPKPAAIAWGYETVRGAMDDAQPVGQHDLDALHAVYSWLSHPDEEARRAALAAVDGIDPETPSLWLAYAVAWSGGSMVMTDPPVPPPDHLTGVAVAAAISLSSTLS